MTRVEQVINMIDYDDANKEIALLDKSAPDYNEKVKGIINKYADKIYNIIKDEDLEVRVAALDFLFNASPTFTHLVLSKKDSNLFDAMLVLERIRGIKASLIKNYTDSVATIEEQAMINGAGKGFQKDITRNAEINGKILHMLHDYIGNKDDDDLDDEVDENTLKFADNLDKVDEILFRFTKRNVYPNRSIIITSLLDLCSVDENILNKMYSKVLCKNPNVASYDYKYIIENHSEYLTSVKGLYRRCTSEIFDLLCPEYINEEDFEELSDYYEAIVECNKDDDPGLRWFFKEINLRANDNQKLRDFLLQKDYYKEYASVDMDKIYDECIDKLLNGKHDIDESFLNRLGTYKGFRDKYDLLLDAFVNSKDDEFKRTLAVPLVTSLIESQKEKYGVNYKSAFSTAAMGATTFGYYNHEYNIMYVNPIFFKQFKDVDKALVYACNTVFHETRHACQYKEVKNSDAVSYDNLLMAMDLVLKEQESLTGYYKNNYAQIGYEKDARDKAFVDTMTAFRKYPELQSKYEDSYDADFRLNQYVRREQIDKGESYYGVLAYFCKNAIFGLQACKTEDDIEYYKELYGQYPVINTFFDIDYEKKTIRIRSEEELRSKVNTYKEGSIERKEGEYSIKAFNYSKKVSKYLEEKVVYVYDREDTKSYDPNVIEEVIDNVGKSPSR